jgi:cystathionine beta-lyase/cystathionine gamma-synthase
VAAFAALGPAGETPHAVPLFQNSNFAYPDARAAARAADGRAFLYGRHGSPTVDALERALAELDGGERGLAFASGMAAITAATLGLAVDATADRRGRGERGQRPELLASEGIYGGSTELLRAAAAEYGLGLRFVPAWDTPAVAAAVTPATRVLLIETASNPLLRIPDLPALGRLARQRGFALVVDASISTPLLVRPLEHGASVVVHSLSKYVGGHGDLIGGIAVGGAAVMSRLARQRTLTGAVMDPFCAWLALRGLRTLAVRLDRQCATAAALAKVLDRHPRVRAVYYPGLADHPDRARCRRLLAAPGAMLSFQLASGAAARRFYDRVRIVTRAASFGEVTSLLTHPATFSHKGLSAAERKRLGIDDGLLRLSVGLEDPADLEADVKQALA